MCKTKFSQQYTELLEFIIHWKQNYLTRSKNTQDTIFNQSEYFFKFENKLDAEPRSVLSKDHFNPFITHNLENASNLFLKKMFIQKITNTKKIVLS